MPKRPIAGEPWNEFANLPNNFDDIGFGVPTEVPVHDFESPVRLTYSKPAVAPAEQTAGGASPEVSTSGEQPRRPGQRLQTGPEPATPQHGSERAGLAIKGSQRQLQLHVNVPELRAELEARLCALAPSITAGSIEWRSPLLSEGYREYADRAFVSTLGRVDLAEQLGEFWPGGGPVRDGLATFRTTDGQQGALLVEAKAHGGELLRGGTLGKSVSADSRRKIERSLAAARARLEVKTDEADWTVDRYQSANRLAHALWLGEHLPTVLAQVLFHDDPTHRSESKSTLEDAAAEVYQGLGFTGAPPAFAITVLCPGADPLDLTPSTLPAWAREPVDLHGVEVTRQSYPPEVGHRTRSEMPAWALVGGREWENNEIAVAAFPHGLEFGILTHWRDGPHDPVTAVTPVQRVAWDEFPPDSAAALAAVGLLARAAARRRRQSYRTCADCGEPVAPEGRDRMAGKYVCHGCQERRHGIVH